MHRLELVSGKRWLIFWAFACLALAGALGPTSAAPTKVEGRRAALVIGNGAYARLPSLPNAANDATRISEVLREANFEVTLGENLDKEGLERTVRAFLQTLDDGDVALFYYSGHAVQVAGENFIIPTDASLSSAYDLEVEGMGVSNLLDYMRAASSMQILVLDACRDNPFQTGQVFLGPRKVEVEGNKGLASLTPRQGSLIVYSTSPDEVAYDGKDGLSPFTEAFAGHVLRSNQEVRSVLTEVRNAVIGATGGRQVPWDVSSLTSHFYFVSGQNLLVLDQTTMEVRVSPDRREVPLGIAPPVASGGMKLSASFDQLPKNGMLLLDGAALKAGAVFPADRIGAVVYATDAGEKPVELLPYTIRSDTGESAKGAVAIVFDATLGPGVEEKPQLIAGEDVAKPVLVAMDATIGTGFAPLPPAIGGGRSTSGWLRVEQRDPATQIAVDQTLLVVGDLVSAKDLERVSVRPALHSGGIESAKVVLTPVDPAPGAAPVVIAVDATADPCDRLAAEPLDIQGVSEGVLPNDIQIAEAVDACRKAVARFPDVPRFRFQLGRALYAQGAFREAVDELEQALAGGHVRAGQFLGRLYQLGSGVPLDPAKAVPLFETAAKRGDPYGQYSLGRALIEGNGMAVDTDRGMKLLAQAAESGHTYALNQLGSEYLYGTRVSKDVERARKMFETSAGRGDVWGEVNLGLMVRDGVAGAADPARARELFTEANAKLHPYAGTLLGMMEREGGAAQPSAVLKLFRQSASRGDGWGALYAADMVSADPALAQDSGEAARLYALAVARKAGKASERARAALAKMDVSALASEIQKALIRLGASDIDIDGRIGPRVREAGRSVLGAAPPDAPVDFLAALIRTEWVASMPRLDML